jgi:hypothetical protein
MKLMIPRQNERVVNLKVEHGVKPTEDGYEPMVWTVRFKMLDVATRNALFAAQLSLTEEEKANHLIKMVLEQTLEVSSPGITFEMEDGVDEEGNPKTREVDWSSLEERKNVLGYEVFGVLFITKIWLAYEREIEDRLGKFFSR